MIVYHHKSYFNCIIRKDVVESRGKRRIPESGVDTWNRYVRLQWQG